MFIVPIRRLFLPEVRRVLSGKRLNGEEILVLMQFYQTIRCWFQAEMWFMAAAVTLNFRELAPVALLLNKGNTVYIGDVLNATMQDSAKVLKALGMDNAMNLDEGGSTALWSGGYKLGPGRNLPNAILFRPQVIWSHIYLAV